jgi:hypothetical protein
LVPSGLKRKERAADAALVSKIKKKFGGCDVSGFGLCAGPAPSPYVQLTLHAGRPGCRGRNIGACGFPVTGTQPGVTQVQWQSYSQLTDGHMQLSPGQPCVCQVAITAKGRLLIAHTRADWLVTSSLTASISV